MGFRDIRWLSAPRGVTDSEMQSIESFLGRRLPEDYRDFLRRHGGGLPLLADFHFPDGDIEFHASVGLFLGVDPGGGADLIDVLKRTEFFPEGLVPIADDGGGNHLCLDYRDSPRPRIVYWHHGRRGDSNEISQVCSSFTEFGDMLVCFEDDG